MGLIIFAAGAPASGLNTKTLHLMIVVLALGAAGVWACLRWGSRPPRRPGGGDSGTRRRPAGGPAPSPVPIAPGRGTEQRRHPRRGGWRVQVLISDAAGGAPPLDGVLVNRSRGGLCLTSPGPADVGVVLSVRSTRAPADAGWARVVVRRCKPQGGRWEIGCEFEDEPSLGLITQFG